MTSVMIMMITKDDNDHHQRRNLAFYLFPSLILKYTLFVYQRPGCTIETPACECLGVVGSAEQKKQESERGRFLGSSGRFSLSESAVRRTSGFVLLDSDCDFRHTAL